MIGSELPSYILFQYHVDNEVFNSLKSNWNGGQEQAKPAGDRKQKDGKSIEVEHAKEG